MFHFFRRRDTAVRWFLGGMLVLVCVMLVVTLIPGITTPSTGEDATVLAKVCGEPVTYFQVQRQFQQMSSNNRLPASFLAIYAPQIINTLTTERATRCEARRMGLQVTPTELAETLRTNPGLFPGGVFIGADRYRELIEGRLGVTVEQFEQQMADNLLADKLRRLVSDGVTVSVADIEREYRKNNDKVKVDYVALRTSDFLKEVKVHEDDLKAFFEKTRPNYEIPEKRPMKMAYLDLKKIREDVQVTPQELRRYYELNRERFRMSDRVRTSHVLLKTEGKTPDQVKELEKKAREILAKAKAGEDFAKLSEQFSEDEVAKKQGGDINWVGRGQTATEYEKAAFALEPGQFSDVVKTQFGYHVIKCTGRERARLQTLDEVSATILPEVKRDKSEGAAIAAGDRLDAAVRKNPKSLEAVAAQLNMMVIEAPDHARNDPLPGLGPQSPIDEALFSSGLKPGEMSGVISAQDYLAVVRLDKIIPPRQAELPEVRDRVEPRFKDSRAQQIAKDRAAELFGRAKAVGLKKAAAEKKYTLKNSEPMNVEGRIPDLGAAVDFPAQAFQMKVGDVGGPVAIGNDIQMVYQVAEFSLVTADDLAKNRDSVKSRILEDRRNAFFDLYVAELKERLKREGKITTNDAAIRRLTQAPAQ